MKKIILVLMVAMLSLGICGCGSDNEYLIEERDSLQAEISELQSELEELETMVAEEKEEKCTAKYVITFNISQKHYTLDISQHIKDSMNDITIQIPVDKEYYDSVEVGDTINDTFRMGSLIMCGSFGSWNVTVEDKEIQ